MLFKSPRHGVTIAEARHEAANIATAELLMLHTFELWHPTLAETIYVVNNFEPLLATKEAEAERDPSTEVEFLAADIMLERPTETDLGQAPELDLMVSNVSGQVGRAMRVARGSPVPWEIIERIYDATDTSAPVETPMRLIVASVDINAKTVRLRCSFTDPANMQVPRTTFRRAHYPGLVR